jgi:hypothetical protein
VAHELELPAVAACWLVAARSEGSHPSACHGLAAGGAIETGSAIVVVHAALRGGWRHGQAASAATHGVPRLAQRSLVALGTSRRHPPARHGLATLPVRADDAVVIAFTTEILAPEARRAHRSGHVARRIGLGGRFGSSRAPARERADEQGRCERARLAGNPTSHVEPTLSRPPTGMLLYGLTRQVPLAETSKPQLGFAVQ